MNINFSAFISSLYYMGVGMLSIFIVIGVIIAITYLLNYFSSKASSSENSDDQ